MKFSLSSLSPSLCVWMCTFALFNFKCIHVCAHVISLMLFAFFHFIFIICLFLTMIKPIKSNLPIDRAKSSFSYCECCASKQAKLCCMPFDMRYTHSHSLFLSLSVSTAFVCNLYVTRETWHISLSLYGNLYICSI